jgi:Effector protein
MFKQGAMNDLAAMLQTDVGRQEIALLQNNPVRNPVDDTMVHHTSTIKPDFDHRPRGESGDDWREGYGTAADPGAGTDFVTRYTPGEALDHPGNNPWYPIRSDVILFHELRHGVDQTRGQMNPGTVTTQDAKVFEKNDDGTINPERFSWDHDILLDRGDNDLEHEAIGIGNYADKPMTENQYRNERNAIGQLDPDSSLPGDGTMQERHRHTWIPNERPEKAAVAEALRLERRTRNQRR